MATFFLDPKNFKTSVIGRIIKASKCLRICSGQLPIAYELIGQTNRQPDAVGCYNNQISQQSSSRGRSSTNLSPTNFHGSGSFSTGHYPYLVSQLSAAQPTSGSTYAIAKNLENLENSWSSGSSENARILENVGNAKNLKNSGSSETVEKLENVEN